MTYKSGLTIGLFSGFVGWLVYHGYITFSPAPELARNFVFYLAGFFFVLSVILVILNAVRKKATLGTTGDGFVYGFTLAFDILYILTQLYLGKFPFSKD